MAKPRNRYSDRHYQLARSDLRKRVATESLPCARCLRPIDTRLAWPDPQSFTADHVHGLADGGHIAGDLEPMHLGCNSARGGQQGARRRRERLRRHSYHEESPGLM